MTQNQESPESYFDPSRDTPVKEAERDLVVGQLIEECPLRISFFFTILLSFSVAIDSIVGFALQSQNFVLNHHRVKFKGLRPARPPKTCLSAARILTKKRKEKESGAWWTQIVQRALGNTSLLFLVRAKLGVCGISAVSAGGVTEASY